MKRKEFKFTVCHDQEPHAGRRKQISTASPLVYEFRGVNRLSFVMISLLVFVQFTISYFLADTSIWVVLASAYLAGAFICHGLLVMIHECSHRLVFRSTGANRVAGIIANLPILIPSYIQFERYHLKHHAFLGRKEFDGSIPFQWEAALISNSWWRKLMWLCFQFVFQLLRSYKLDRVKLNKKWLLLNVALQLSCNIAVYSLFGFEAILYLFLSFLFSTGLHPLGGRWLQEHYVLANNQETNSYYGWLNLLSFNVGYHTEHHDFPSVPWNKLPLIKKAALSRYQNRIYFNSWTKLIVDFVFNKNRSLFDKVIRSKP